MSASAAHALFVSPPPAAAAAAPAAATEEEEGISDWGVGTSEEEEEEGPATVPLPAAAVESTPRRVADEARAMAEGWTPPRRVQMSDLDL